MKTELDIVTELTDFIRELESRIEKAKQAISALTGIMVVPLKEQLKMAEALPPRWHKIPPPVDDKVQSLLCPCGNPFTPKSKRSTVCPRCAKKASNQKQRAKKNFVKDPKKTWKAKVKPVTQETLQQFTQTTSTES